MDGAKQEQEDGVTPKVEFKVIGLVLSNSIGIEVYGGFMKIIVPRKSPLPVQKSMMITTTADFQLTGRIKIFAGERPRVKDNQLILEGRYTGISNGKFGEPQMEVNIDVDGLGNVTAVIRETGAGSQSGNEVRLGPVQVSIELPREMEKDGNEMDEEDEAEWKRIEAYWNLSEYCLDLKNMFEVRLAQVVKNDPDTPQILNTVNQALEWVKGATEASAKNLTRRLYEVEDVVMPKIEQLLDSGLMDAFGNPIVEVTAAASSDSEAFDQPEPQQVENEANIIFEFENFGFSDPPAASNLNEAIQYEMELDAESDPGLSSGIPIPICKTEDNMSWSFENGQPVLEIKLFPNPQVQDTNNQPVKGETEAANGSEAGNEADVPSFKLVHVVIEGGED